MSSKHYNNLTTAARCMRKIVAFLGRLHHVVALLCILDNSSQPSQYRVYIFASYRHAW